MEIIEIKTFLTVVETKSLSKTAEMLFITQPSVTHRLKSLESQLGYKLIIREQGKKNIHLTRKGELFIPIAMQWLALWQEAKLLYNQQDPHYIYIGCTDSFNNLLSPLFTQLLSGTPKIDLNLRTQQSNEIYDLLSSYAIDLGFVHHSLNYRNITSEEVFREDLLLIQSRSGAIEKDIVNTDELNPESELFFSWNNTYQIWHDQCFGTLLRPHVQIDSITLMDQLWSKNSMWAVAPESIVKIMQQKHDIHVSRLAEPPPQRITYMLVNKQPKQSTIKSVEWFQNQVRHFIQGLNY